MKFAVTISSIALMLTSGLNALSIVQPTTGSTVNAGESLQIEVINDLGESYTNAELSIASPAGNLVINTIVGTPQSIYLPCNIIGQTSIVARTTEAVSNHVLIMVNPAIPAYPYIDPACGNPCGPIACPPRSSRSSRRSRRGCGYYLQEASKPEEFKIEDFQQQE